jgi:nickel-dependent lactate racemase
MRRYATSTELAALPPLLRRLHDSGVPIHGVTILIATGLHRGATEEEIQRILGPEIAATYRVVNHDASAGEDHRWLGSTSKGTPVYIDERFMAVNLHISLALSSSI